MARFFHHHYTTINKKTGKRELRETKNWYFEYTDEFGKTKREPGFKDLLATKRKATALEYAVIQRLRGERPTEPRPASRPLTEHLGDYCAHLRAKADTERHIGYVRRRCTEILRAIKCEHFDELKRSRVENWLQEQRSKGRFGAESSNHHARAIKGFCRWLADELSVPNPLSGLRLINAEVDRKRIRRVLSDDDFAKLIDKTKSRTSQRRFPGADRAMMYQIAAFTGLRRSEMLSLTVDSFNFSETTATVTIEAKHAKGRRTDAIPIPAWLVPDLRRWLKGRTGKLWPAGIWIRMSKILKADLAAAGIPYTDKDGRVFDFHALRSQYCTGLVRAGVPLATAQRLARHSDPKLTAKYYTRLEIDELGEAANKLQRPARKVKKRGKKR